MHLFGKFNNSLTYTWILSYPIKVINTNHPLTQSVTCDDDLARSSESFILLCEYKHSQDWSDRDIGSELANWIPVMATGKGRNNGWHAFVICLDLFRIVLFIRAQLTLYFLKGLCHEMNIFLRFIIINRYFLYMRWLFSQFFVA